MKNEGSVKKEVKKLLDTHGWFWWMPPANMYGKSGIADLLALRGGVFMAIETKFGSNKPTVNQKAFLESIIAESGFGFVVNEKNLDWFKAWLEAFDRSAKLAAEGKPPVVEDGAMMVNAINELTREIV